MKHIAKVYSIKPIRLTFKFMVCLAGVKIIGDYLYSFTIGFNTTFPRCTFSEQGIQHPLNPPIIVPYPMERQARQLDDIRQVNMHMQKIMQVLFVQKYQWSKLYKSHPQRQNPNDIDHFLVYSESSRIMDVIYPKVLRKMKDSGSQIPEGINQKLRQLSQFQFKDCTNKIVPLL